MQEMQMKTQSVHKFMAPLMAETSAVLQTPFFSPINGKLDPSNPEVPIQPFFMR